MWNCTLKQVAGCLICGRVKKSDIALYIPNVWPFFMAEMMNELWDFWRIFRPTHMRLPSGNLT
jgi:hypothetical protein